MKVTGKKRKGDLWKLEAGANQAKFLLLSNMEMVGGTSHEIWSAGAARWKRRWYDIYKIYSILMVEEVLYDTKSDGAPCYTPLFDGWEYMTPTAGYTILHSII